MQGRMAAHGTGREQNLAVASGSCAYPLAIPVRPCTTPNALPPPSHHHLTHCRSHRRGRNIAAPHPPLAAAIGHGSGRANRPGRHAEAAFTGRRIHSQTSMPPQRYCQVGEKRGTVKGGEGTRREGAGTCLTLARGPVHGNGELPAPAMHAMLSAMHAMLRA